MNKKGAELSMNVIIIAAIGLLILVILAILVINSGGKIAKGTATCNLKGGVCKETCTDPLPTPTDGWDCTSPKAMCCPLVST